MCLIQAAKLHVLPDAPLAPLLLHLPLHSPGGCALGQALERDVDHHSSLVHTLWEPFLSRACSQLAGGGASGRVRRTAGALNTVMLVAQPRGSELRIHLCGGEAEFGLDVGGWAPDQRGLTLLPGPQQPPPFPEEHPDSELRRKLPNTS